MPGVARCSSQCPPLRNIIPLFFTGTLPTFEWSRGDSRPTDIPNSEEEIIHGASFTNASYMCCGVTLG